MYVGMGQMVIQDIFLYFFRQGLSLYLELVDVAKLVSAGDSAVHLFPAVLATSLM